MALRRTLSKRLFRATTPDSPPPITTLLRSPHPPPHAAKAHFRREFLTSPDSGFFRRFLQKRAINNHSSPNALPSFLTLPVGEKLREKLKSINITGDDQRLRLDGLSPPLPTTAEEEGFRVGAADAKRVLRFVQMEKVREKLRNIPASTIQYGEYLRVCCDVAGNRETGLEFAKALDESGNVIVLGGVVFLQPDQVAKSIEELISRSIAMPNDPRRKELNSLENEKARIDEKARSIVHRELYCGLGFWFLQTMGFMRLTFWELSWDVMEPICFFVTSLHFALAYAFFLRTSKEPTFEGYFQRRFKLKQEKIMREHNFDLERYNQLCEVFYGRKRDGGNVVECLDRVRGAVFGSVHG
ncbi:Calcium uniporter protein 4, mitochondrial [Sesamum alatum]|uniref:Calcium uniporter protein 4, mitochondrial n=1 Tax=Sesamum alatum TaxID=300844 RepID=A0AAE1YFD1_9LAMI|nr:Calcium uniporter protein 4, mitochondrial [Sesamum alatum]